METGERLGVVSLALAGLWIVVATHWGAVSSWLGG